MKALWLHIAFSRLGLSCHEKTSLENIFLAADKDKDERH